MDLSRFLHANSLVMGLLVFLTTPVSTTNHGHVQDLRSLTDEGIKSLTVRFERTACYGSCPAYTLTIHGDGRLQYFGKAHVKETGTREGRMDTDKIKSLLSEFSNANFMEIEEKYSVEKCRGRFCTDLPTATTEISIKGVTHRVTHYYGCGAAPKSLFALESAIDKLANSEQWTGDVGKAGPFGTTCMDGK